MLVRGLYDKQLRIEQRTFLTPSRRKLDVNIVQSNYHIEITPRCALFRSPDCRALVRAKTVRVCVHSDLGNYDRAVVQEVLKDIAQTQQVDLNARKRFKGALLVVRVRDQGELTVVAACA